MRQQRRGRKIAMTTDEMDAFLSEQRTCRVATTGPDGPHVTPLWFVWHGGALWLTSLSRSQRWTDLQRDRGVELRGRVEVVGDMPRTDGPVPELDGPEQAFADRYTGGTIVRDGRHGWMRLAPEKITSWDFRKIPTTNTGEG
jgi:hypothetical protein